MKIVFICRDDQNPNFKVATECECREKSVKIMANAMVLRASKMYNIPIERLWCVPMVKGW